MSLREAREQLKQAQRHIEAATKAIESASPAIPPYIPRVGDVVSVDLCGRMEAIIVDVGPVWKKACLLLNANHSVVFQQGTGVAASIIFVRRATPAEMAQFGLVEKDVTKAYAPEIGHLVQYCEDGVNVRQGAVVALDGVRTTVRLVNSAEAGLLDSVPRSSDYCLAFIRYATGEEMGIKVGEPSPIWMPRNYESWMLADMCPMVARDCEKSYVVKRSVAPSGWDVEIDRGLGFTFRALCDDKAQAMDVAQAMAGKTLEWRRWF